MIIPSPLPGRRNSSLNQHMKGFTYAWPESSLGSSWYQPDPGGG